MKRILHLSTVLVAAFLLHMHALAGSSLRQRFSQFVAPVRQRISNPFQGLFKGSDEKSFEAHQNARHAAALRPAERRKKELQDEIAKRKKLEEEKQERNFNEVRESAKEKVNTREAKEVEQLHFCNDKRPLGLPINSLKELKAAAEAIVAQGDRTFSIPKSEILAFMKLVESHLCASQRLKYHHPTVSPATYAYALAQHIIDLVASNEKVSLWRAQAKTRKELRKAADLKRTQEEGLREEKKLAEEKKAETALEELQAALETVRLQQEVAKAQKAYDESPKGIFVRAMLEPAARRQVTAEYRGVPDGKAKPDLKAKYDAAIETAFTQLCEQKNGERTRKEIIENLFARLTKEAQEKESAQQLGWFPVRWYHQLRHYVYPHSYRSALERSVIAWLKEPEEAVDGAISKYDALELDPKKEDARKNLIFNELYGGNTVFMASCDWHEGDDEREKFAELTVKTYLEKHKPRVKQAIDQWFGLVSKTVVGAAICWWLVRPPLQSAVMKFRALKFFQNSLTRMKPLPVGRIRAGSLEAANKVPLTARKWTLCQSLAALSRSWFKPATRR